DASAQYFGRNKVQYKKLNFQVLKTEHFDIYFYPEEREGIDISARLAERWNTRLERLLAHKLRGRQPLVLYASHPDFEQTAAREPDDKSKLPNIDDLDSPKYFPYRWGQAFWAYVGGRWGDAVIPQMLRLAGATGDPSVAIQRVLGVSTKELSNEWHAAIKSAYEPVLHNTTPPAEVGRVSIKASGLGGDLNVGPSISPDGRWIAFLSERGIFS